MTVLVTQPNSEYASHQVNVLADGEFVGSVGLGGSLMVKCATSPCKISAVCGFSSASVFMKSDGELQIRWSLNLPMELVETKQSK